MWDIDDLTDWERTMLEDAYWDSESDRIEEQRHGSNWLWWGQGDEEEEA